MRHPHKPKPCDDRDSSSDGLCTDTGYLLDGKKFDSSYDKGEPFGFRLNKGKVIPGWESIAQGMNVGMKVIVKIPPEFACERPLLPTRWAWPALHHVRREAVRLVAQMARAARLAAPSPPTHHWSFTWRW